MRSRWRSAGAFTDRFYRCSRCEEQFFNGEMMDDSLRRATAVIRAEDGLLAPEEIVELRRKYGLTQAELERLIGAGEKTVVRWERGTVSQNKTAGTLLRTLRSIERIGPALFASAGPILFRGTGARRTFCLFSAVFTPGTLQREDHLCCG